jgi:hypothetical protein
MYEKLKEVNSIANLNNSSTFVQGELTKKFYLKGKKKNLNEAGGSVVDV